MTVRTRIIRIGNSQGVRIPKPLLEQSGISGEVEMEVQADRIIIHAAAHPRSQWEDAFAAMTHQDDDVLLDPEDAPSEWDETEWQW